MAVSRQFDVAIVGAGPAGSSTALHLVRACGVQPDRIVVIDRAKHPRDKPCGGAVSAWGVSALERVGVRMSVPVVPMAGVAVLEAGARGETLDPGVGVVVRRDAFDASLVSEVRADGVVVREGEGLEALERRAGGLRLRTNLGEIDTKLVCACDGVGSSVRRLLGIPEAARRGHLYVTDTAPTSADSAILRGVCDFDFSPIEDGVAGYAWDFPTPAPGGGMMVNRGIFHANLARPDKGASVDVKGALARFLARRGIAIGDVVLRPYPIRPLVKGSVLQVRGVALVGEAAGIDRVTGEGIAQAILYGEVAARHVARALRLGSDDFSAYAREVVASRFGRHLLQSAWLAERALIPRGAAFRRALVRSEAARRVGIAWYRGEPISLATRLKTAAVVARSFARA